MGLSVKKVWLWTKMVVIIALVTWIVLFLVQNKGTNVDIWLFFGSRPNLPLIVILPVTALASIIGFSVFRKVSGVLTQLRQVRESEKTAERERQLKDLLAREAMEKASSEARNEPRT